MDKYQLIALLTESMEAAAKEQAEIEARYSGAHWTKPATYDACLRDPRWQYLDGLRVGFNTAAALAMDLQRGES